MILEVNNLGATYEDLNDGGDNDKNFSDEEWLYEQPDDIDVEQPGEEIEYTDEDC